jgi:hypothetical protein
MIFTLIRFSLVILSATPFVAFANSAKPLSIEVHYEDLKVENGKLDRESARRSLVQKQEGFNKCGFTAGKLELSFQASEAGKITDSKAVLSPNPDQATQDCFLKVLHEIDFSHVGIEESVRMSIQFSIGREEQEKLALTKQRAAEINQAKAKNDKAVPNDPETEADRKNREYAQRKRAQALAEMSAQIERQKAEQATSIECYQKFQKDKLLENYEKCLAKGNQGGNSCKTECESKRLNLMVQCESCQGNHVAKNNCRTSCTRNVDNQINSCMSGCR